LLVCLLTGCVTPQVAELHARPDPSLPARVELGSVPFFPQSEYQCGPAALATVLVNAGIATSPDALVSQVYLPGREGSLQAEMLASARRHGLVAYRLSPRLADLLREVAAGHPAVVLQNLSFDFAPVWHYAVVIGYDLPRDEIVLRSGITERLAVTMSNFERTWARGQHWAMVPLAPRTLPVTAVADNYVADVAALERVQPGAAKSAYETALERWPAHPVALVGVGNAAYRLRDLDGAERAYRKAAEALPASGDAWNNLAQVLLEKGRRDEAREAAKKAVALGGARARTYEETLKSIDGP
jgi:tetratricopeptide (TPR) repeat protein